MKTATEYCRTEQQIQEMHGALCTQHVSLNNARTRTVYIIRFRRSSGHVTLQILTRPPADIMFAVSDAGSFLKDSPKPKNIF